MVTNLRQNLCCPFQVLLLQFRVPAAIPSQINQVRSDLNADVQRPPFNVSTRPGIGRHYWAPSVIGEPTALVPAVIRIRSLYFPKKTRRGAVCHSTFYNDHIVFGAPNMRD
jgi:hypothetical protein